MKTIHVSATDARNNFFQLLNQVMYEGVRVIIGKAGTNREVMLEPKTSDEEKFNNRMTAVNETYGALKDTPVSYLSDDRLRGKRAKEYLQNIRKKW